MPGAYDPDLNLYYVGAGNPNPMMAEKSRKGDNLYTCSIIAINPDTGKLSGIPRSRPMTCMIGTRPKRRCCAHMLSTCFGLSWVASSFVTSKLRYALAKTIR